MTAQDAGAGVQDPREAAPRPSPEAKARAAWEDRHGSLVLRSGVNNMGAGKGSEGGGQ